MYYLEGGYNKRMRAAVMAAVAIHIALVLGVSFRASDPSEYTPQIEVTLATRPSDSNPVDARHIAQSSQLGSGQEAQRTTLSSPRLDQPAAALPARPTPPQPLPEQALERELLSTTADARRAVTEEQDRAERPQSLPEYASLPAERDEQFRNEAAEPRVRRLTSVSAAQAVDAAYLLDWRRRLEAVGNKYYPEASIRYGIYGELRLLVVIRKDGSLEDIRVLSTSGYAVLDEAAIKIVRMAAPYSPFPPELAATTDKLEIVRTWQFQENSLGSD